MPATLTSVLKSLFGKTTETKKGIFHSIKAKANAKRTILERTADVITSSLGSNTFLLFNILLFTSWILINTGRIKGVEIFDPFPFSLLTTMVSLEAIVLAIIVLISQNRNSRVDDL